MATDMETTVEPTGSENGLLNFNWDDSGDDSFFNLNSAGEEPVKQEEPTQVIKTVGESEEKPKEVKPPKEVKTVEPVIEDEFFDLVDDGDPDMGDEGKEGEKDPTQGSVYEDVYKDLKEAGIFKHVELEEGEELTVDRFYEIQQEEIEAEVADQLKTWASKDLDEDAQAFIKFKIAGGDTKEFFSTYGKNSKIGSGDITDEGYQDKLIRTQLESEGWDRDEIEDRIEYLTENGKKEKFAERYHAKIQKQEEADRILLEEQNQSRQAAARQQEQQFKTSISETLNAMDDYNGLKFTEEDKTSLVSYLTKKSHKIDDNRSVTEFQAKLQEAFNEPKKVVLLAKLLKSDFDFSTVAKTAVTKKTKEIKRNIEQRQNTRPNGSGSSIGGKDLASLFDK